MSVARISRATQAAIQLHQMVEAKRTLELVADRSGTVAYRELADVWIAQIEADTRALCVSMERALARQLIVYRKRRARGEGT